MYVVIVGDGIWTSRFTFDNRRGVVLSGSMAYDARVPNVCSSQVANSSESFGSNSVECATSIFLQCACMTSRLVVVGESTRQQLINNRFQGSEYNFMGKPRNVAFPMNDYLIFLLKNSNILNKVHGV